MEGEPARSEPYSSGFLLMPTTEKVGGGVKRGEGRAHGSVVSVQHLLQSYKIQHVLKVIKNFACFSQSTRDGIFLSKS